MLEITYRFIQKVVTIYIYLVAEIQIFLFKQTFKEIFCGYHDTVNKKCHTVHMKRTSVMEPPTIANISQLSERHKSNSSMCNCDKKGNLPLKFFDF